MAAPDEPLPWDENLAEIAPFAELRKPAESSNEAVSHHLADLGSGGIPPHRDEGRNGSYSQVLE